MVQISNSYEVFLFYTVSQTAIYFLSVKYVNMKHDSKSISLKQIWGPVVRA